MERDRHPRRLGVGLTAPTQSREFSEIAGTIALPIGLSLQMQGTGNVVVGLILWAQIFGFYLVLAQHVGTAEWLAGAPAALPAAALGALLHRGVRGTKRFFLLRTNSQ